jgi:nucleoside recognition membrane protein YjiH
MKSLAIGEAAEVKALTPSVLVEICGQVVISKQSADGHELEKLRNSLSCEAGIVVSSLLSNGLDFVFSLLVVPVLKVVVNGSGVGLVVLVHHGTHSALGIL